VNDLDSIALDAAEVEAELKYKLFFESVLNIIDNDLPIEDRYRSRSVLVELFENTNSNIFDIIDTKFHQSYNPHTYSFKLLEAEKTLPIYHKKYKFSDDLKFDTLSFRGLNDLNKASFGIYEADLYVLEKLTTSSHIKKSILNAPSFNAYENGLVKKVRFRIMHDENDNYKLSIESISIHADVERDYKEIKNNIEQNEYDWSDKSSENYLIALQEEATNNGIELVPLIRDFDEIEIDSVEMRNFVGKDTSTYLPASFIDYIVPGIGHMKYGRRKSNRVIVTTAYGTVFATSLGYAVYSKIQANNYYNKHVDAETFRLSNENLALANKHNKRFIISGGISLLTWAANAVHLKINDGKQRQLIIKGKGIDKLELGYDLKFSQSDDLGLALNIYF